jgi:hypothetical protein
MKLDNPVACLSLNLEARVGHQAISCGICGGRIGTGIRFSQRTYFVPCRTPFIHFFDDV